MAIEKLVIALVTDLNYLPYALFQCQEIWKWNQDQQIFILYDSPFNPPSEWMTFIKESPNLQFQSVDKLHIPESLRDERHVSRTTYVKMLLPIYLAENHKIALYIDSDILILRNLFKHLSKLDVPEHVCAVRIPDFEGLHLNEFVGPYFNAGVMLFNIESELVRKWPQDLNQAAGEKFKYQDQDLLNTLLKSKWREIESKFNYFPYSARNLKRQLPVVVHFIGPDKPWIARQPTWYHIIWIYRYNSFVEAVGSGNLKINLSLKQRLFPLVWNPGGRLALKVITKLRSISGK